MKRAIFALLTVLALAAGGLAQDNENTCTIDDKPGALEENLAAIQEAVLKQMDTGDTPAPGKGEATGSQAEGEEGDDNSCPRPKDDDTVTVRVDPQNGKQTPDVQTSNGQNGKQENTTANGQNGQQGQEQNGQGEQGEEENKSSDQRFEDEHPFWAAFFEMLPDLIDILIDHWPDIERDWPEIAPEQNDWPSGPKWPTVDTDGPPIVSPDGPSIYNPDGPPIVNPNGPPIVNPEGPPIVNPDGPPVVDPDGPPIVINDNPTTQDTVDEATARLIDAGLADGKTVAEIQDILQDVINGKYDEKGAPTAEDILQQALDGGLFGGGDGGTGDGGCFGNGNGEASDGGCFGGPGGSGDPWGNIMDKVKTTTLEKLESWTSKQLDAWINKNPTLQKWLEALGIDGNSIVNGVKDIWGVLTGNGSLSDKLSQLVSKAQNTLCNMAANVLKYGLDKLGQWLSGIGQKWIGKLTGALNKIFGGHGIKIPQKLLNKFQAALNKLVGRGVGKVVDIGKEYIDQIIDGVRPETDAPTGNGTGNGTTVSEYGVESVW